MFYENADKEGVKGGPYFPTIIVQNNFSGLNS